VAGAIGHAHERGIIHRDVKPSNILIDVKGEPRVTDFGLAKLLAVDSELTATGQILGTPNYMSPEQATGQVARIGPLSDVYSLGATLCCLLTGRPPFQAATTVETIQ
jgi:serine/threonine protein kinase